MALTPLIEMDVRWSLVHELRQALGLAEALMVLSSAEVDHPHDMAPEIMQQRQLLAGISRRLCAAELVKRRQLIDSAFENWSKSL